MEVELSGIAMSRITIPARNSPLLESLKECDGKTVFCRLAGFRFPGAGEGIRTPDPLITNQMLYQLSYASEAGDCAPRRHKPPLTLTRVRDNCIKYHNGTIRA